VPDGRPVSTGASRAVLHTGVSCDGKDCNMRPIRGVRFKCAVRHDYDLCEGCESRTVRRYPMVKIYDSIQAPKAVKLEAPSPGRRFVRCNDCKEDLRSKPALICTVRESLVLCAPCEAAAPQPYPMVKIADAASSPATLNVQFFSAPSVENVRISCSVLSFSVSPTLLTASV
jgi:hypothetical protein